MKKNSFKKYIVTKNVISIFLIIVAILWIMWPDLLILFSKKFDIYSTLLIVFALLIFFFEALKKQFKSAKAIKKSTWNKGILLLLCFSIIILRMFFKDLNFDNTSLYILIFIGVIILIPDLKDLLLRIRKVKKGDFELEIGEALSELKEDVNKVEEKLETDPAPKANYSNDPPDMMKYIIELANEPRALILITSAEIEKRIRNLGFEADVEKNDDKMPVFMLMKRLFNYGVIPEELIPLYRNFQKIRNLVAHGKGEEISNAELYEVSELGIRILSLIPTHVVR
ncbi:hypothetical protein NST04_28900 [Paenibacillus sp. FSL H7-0756]|uniref:hypothetical protein n=1 Tax=Paenibacillus sp. FSL H7-0756 TaxID=2954738 RepID=UPI0030FC95AE